MTSALVDLAALPPRLTIPGITHWLLNRTPPEPPPGETHRDLVIDIQDGRTDIDTLMGEAS